MPDLFEQRIADLRRELNRHNYNYYVLNAPSITDREFDALMRELEDLERAYPEYDDPLSPTRRVGSDISEGFVQVEHERPMQSLSNTYSIEEVQDFLRRAAGTLGGEDYQIVGEMKFDGTSISLIYEHGRLVRAVTRGDGVRGDDVTANVKTIRSVPLQLRPGDYPDKFEVRGEVLMPWKEFERLNRERVAAGDPPLANPRNTAAGTLKTLDSAEVARRGLDAYFYFLLGDILPHDNHYDNMRAVASWGFKVSDSMTILPSIDAIGEFIAYWDTARRSLPIATDGLVFKINSLRQQEELGSTSKFPRWAIAYKFETERACSRLLRVSFEVGRSGVITPVANIEPVQLCGTVVRRASLHNEDVIRAMDIHEGDMLYVEKGGEIIPKIVGVDTSRRAAGSEPVTFPSVCPVCGYRLRRVEGEAAWVCPNGDGCRPQITGRVAHFAARKMMNIDGLGQEMAEKLYDAGLVENVADLYDLKADDLAVLDRMGDASARRIITGIERSLEVPFERVLFALSIPMVGETVAKRLAMASGGIDGLMAMSQERLAEIPDIGPGIAESVVRFFADSANRTTVERLRAAGVKMTSDAREASAGDALAGRTVVVSGVFSRHSRDEYKRLIEMNGGKCAGSVSAKTGILLAGENAGPSKTEKARSLGVTIMGEDEFLALIGADQR